MRRARLEKMCPLSRGVDEPSRLESVNAILGLESPKSDQSSILNFLNTP